MHIINSGQIAHFHKKALFLFIFIAIILFFSCSRDSEEELKNPDATLKACFQAPSAINVGEAVTFDSDCSENATTYSWDFGGQGSSTMANPSFEFANPGEVTIKLSVSNGSETQTYQTTVTVNGVLETSCIQHNNETISTDQIWKTGEIHCVTGFLSIKEATVTIEPGTEVRLMKNASIEIGFNSGESAIVAEGTSESPILFTSGESNPQPGDWVAIKYLEGATVKNILKHCIIEYGGSENFTSDHVGMVELKSSGTLKMENTVLRKSLTHAVKTDFNSGFSSFTYNSISEAGDFAIYTHAPQVHTIGRYNTIDNKGILVDDGLVKLDVTWIKQDCPYYINGGFAIGSTTGNILTLEKGIELKFGTLDLVGVGTYGNTGGIIAQGTSDEPVIFTSSLVGPSAGDWLGIEFGPDTMNGTILDNVIIKYAGVASATTAAVEISTPNVSIQNSFILDCAGLGILQNEGFVSFSNNTIERTGLYPLKINAQQVNSLGADNSFTPDFPIHVTGGIVFGNRYPMEKPWDFLFSRWGFVAGSGQH